MVLDQHRGRFLLRLFGSVAAPETLCLSPADLRRRVTPTGITDVVDQLYERWSFVFLGFELQDPDLDLVSRRLLGANISGVEHFLIYSGEAGFDAEVLGAGITADSHDIAQPDPEGRGGTRAVTRGAKHVSGAAIEGKRVRATREAQVARGRISSGRLAPSLATSSCARPSVRCRKPRGSRMGCGVCQNASTSALMEVSAALAPSE